MKNNVWKAVSIAIILLFACSTFANVHATATQLATPPSIPMATYADFLAYDSGKGEIFVTDGSGTNTVSVISDGTNGQANTVVATVTVQNAPSGLAYDSGKGEIFVANEESSSVSVISDTNNQVVATITSTISAPEGPAYDPAKGEIFVADYDAASFSVISDKNNAVTTIGLGIAGAVEGLGNPYNVCFDTGTGEAFVNCNNAAVNIISDKNNAVVASFPPINGANILVTGFAYDSGKGEMFIGGNNVVYYLSDSSSPSASATPSSSTSASSSPTIPEFGSATLVIVAAAAMVAATCAVAIKAKKRK